MGVALGEKPSTIKEGKMKRISKVGLLAAGFCLFFLGSSFGAATTELDNTCWSMSGNLKVAVNFPGYLNATITVPNVANFGEEFCFLSGGSFEESLLGITSTWEQTGNTFSVNVRDQLGALRDTIVQQYGNYIQSIEIVDASLTGTVAGNRLKSTKLLIVIQVRVLDKEGRITISSSLKGSAETGTAALQPSGKVRLPELVKKGIEKLRSE
jgi:hypothetical protein